MAIDLIAQGECQGIEVDEEARIALQKDQVYVESLISAQKLREREQITLSEEQVEEIDNILLGGVSDN
jgi:hypothetical protein